MDKPWFFSTRLGRSARLSIVAMPAMNVVALKAQLHAASATDAATRAPGERA